MWQTPSRRDFLTSVTANVALASPLLAFLESCKSVSQETESSDLSADLGNIKPSLRMNITNPKNSNNVKLYASAVAAMKRAPFPGGGTWWEAQARIHEESCPHGNWFFLPWHRAYLFYFENVCRHFCGDPNFSLPFWDWNEGANIPAVAYSMAALNDNTRDIKQGSPLGVSSTRARAVNEILNISDFLSFGGGPSTTPRAEGGFTGRLEGSPHNNVHATIGGNMGTYLSPLDPIFWLHHCNVDRLWAAWSKMREDQAQPRLPPKLNSTNSTLTRDYFLKFRLGGFHLPRLKDGKLIARPKGMKVSDLLTIGLLRVTYDQDSQKTLAITSDEDAGVEIDSKGRAAALEIIEQKAIPLTFKAPPANELQLKDSASNKVLRQIEKTAALSEIFEKAIADRGANEATLRLIVDNVPFPSNPKASLNFFFNTDSEVEDALGYVGWLSFFGHKHGTISTVFDLVPVLKKLAKAGKKPFATSNTVTLKAVWDGSGENPSLDQIQFRFEYAELG